MTLPLAHLGHYLWIFYVLPVLIVVGGIIYTSYAGRRDPDPLSEGSGSPEPEPLGQPSRDRSEKPDPPGG